MNTAKIVDVAKRFSLGLGSVMASITGASALGDIDWSNGTFLSALVVSFLTGFFGSQDKVTNKAGE